MSHGALAPWGGRVADEWTSGKYEASVNELLLSSDNDFIINRVGKITSTSYFAGDYTETLNYLIELSNSNEKYNLFSNNCVQKTYIALSKSNDNFKNFEFIRPNRAYNMVLFLANRHPDPLYKKYSKTHCYAMIY